MQHGWIVAVKPSDGDSKERRVRRELSQILLNDSSASVNDAVSHEPPANAFVESDEQRARLEQRIENLPIHEQKLSHLRFFEQLDVKAVAEQLGITVEAMRMWQSRAPRHLRALIVDDGYRN
jgi:RNA polymerase sigma factor (sigma-70 family)